MCLFMFCSSANAFTVPVRYVYDGDTIMITLPTLPKPLSNASVRIMGIDTPELRGKCDSETAAAKLARDYTKSLLGEMKEIELTNFSWDKYGGRIDADVMINGKDLAASLIENNHARPYKGGARSSWCK